MTNHDVGMMAHLMRRAGFGASREELEARAAKGYEATVEELLHSEAQPPLDRNEMMRYHPWTWRPGTLPGMGPRSGCTTCSTPGGPWKKRWPCFCSRCFGQGRSR